MRYQRINEGTQEAVDIRATAFREDKSAALVTITSLSFDRCELISKEAFDTGEQLRLHIPGQGWIKVEVHSIAAGRLQASFVTRSDL